MIFRKALTKVKKEFADRVTVANDAFNRLPKRSQKSAVLVFGILVTMVNVLLIINSRRSEHPANEFKPERIAMPYDIFMNDETEIKEDQLTPVGKMKGEIDGEFESFYVAVDNQGSIYINRDIEFSERAYDKTEDWKQISREKLMEYEKDLHFLPARGKGVKR